MMMIEMRSLVFEDNSPFEVAIFKFLPEMLDILFEVVLVSDFGGVDVARNGEVI